RILCSFDRSLFLSPPLSIPTRRSSDLRSVLSQFFQHLQTACSLHHLDLFPIIHSHSCRIISSVLQFGQPVQQDRRRLLFSNISRSEEHTSELQSRFDLVCRLLLE